MSHDQLVFRLQVWDSVPSFLPVSRESFESCLAGVEGRRSRAGAVGEKTLCLSYSQVFKARVEGPCTARDLSADGVPSRGEPSWLEAETCPSFIPPDFL